MITRLFWTVWGRLSGGKSSTYSAGGSITLAVSALGETTLSVTKLGRIDVTGA